MAALFSGLAAILFAGIWYIYLFVAPLPGMTAFESAGESLKYSFSPENGLRDRFIWLALLPAACIGMAVAYLVNLSATRAGAAGLLIATVVLAILTLVLADPALAVFVGLPALWGYMCLRGT